MVSVAGLTVAVLFQFTVAREATDQIIIRYHLPRKVSIHGRA